MAAPKNVHALESSESLAGFLLTEKDALHVLFFWAAWDEPSKPTGPLSVAIGKLAELHPGVLFATAEAETAVDVTEQFDVSVVPTFIFLKSKAQLDKLEGADVAELTKRVDRFKSVPAPAGGSAGVPKAVQDLNSRITQLVQAAPLMIFIKGSPEEPKCKFSRQLLGILQECGAPFGSFDVLTSPSVRAGLKDFSNWPTFPQVFVHGKLIGGVDIIQELKESGELAGVLPAPMPGSSSAIPAVSPDLRTRVSATVGRSPCVLLMKGPVEAPACGFSEKLVALLQDAGVAFDAVDVLRDPPLREATKAMYAWSTFPALFVRGNLIGGVEALQALATSAAAEGKTLALALGVPAAEPLKVKLTRLSTSAPVVLFMKGTAESPRCGFSARTVDALAGAGLPVRGPAASGVFATVDILADAEVRAGMKDFSNWPTFPQLFVRGEFIGGCDIITEMSGDGSLAELLAPVVAAAESGA